MNLIKLLENALISIKHGLVPLKVAIATAALLALTGVYSVGLFSLLTLGLCLYNVGRRTLSLCCHEDSRLNSSLPPKATIVLTADSATKAAEIFKYSELAVKETDTWRHSRQCSLALKAGFDFIGGEVKPSSLGKTVWNLLQRKISF